MLRLLFVSLLLWPVTGVAQPHVETPLDRVLSAAVASDGRVDYARLGANAGDLEAVLQAVSDQNASALQTDAQKTAFLINAYNAYVLARVVNTNARHIERQDLFAEMFEQTVRVAGMSMTLNQLEHGILRRQSRVDGAAVPRSLRTLRPSRIDYRIHAALNCAAVSCPPLQRRAFRAGSLNADLDRVFSAFAASPRAARLQGRTLVLSSLFDWFASDFEAGGRPVGDLILSAANGQQDALRSRLAGKSAANLRRARSARYTYDWTVNRR